MTLLNNLIASFKQDITRDLAWSVFAPPLLTAEIPQFKPTLNDARILWLQAFDQRKTDWVQDYRLGRYHEYLWTCFFAEDDQYECIEQNLPIQKNGNTIGEIDFIILDKFTRRYIHLEVAVKFYLLPAQAGLSGNTETCHWIGPNTKDNLERKWRHMTEKQMHLCEQAETLEILEKHSIAAENIDSAIALKGYLFSPHGRTLYPPFFNFENTVYSHCNIRQFSETVYSDSVVFGVIPKHCWLTGIHQKNVIVITQQKDIIRHVLKVDSPVMIGIMKDTGNQLEEITRLFLTPASWPGNGDSSM